MAGITVMAINGLIAEAKREGKNKAKADGTVHGLTLTASKSGLGAWVLRFSTDGKRREVTIGKYPELTLSEARGKAKELRAAIKDGIDVATEKQARKREANIEKRDRALNAAMLCQVTDWLSTWWGSAGDSDRRVLFNHWQQAVAGIPGISKWPG